jgi:hypothetical protein
MLLKKVDVLITKKMTIVMIDWILKRFIDQDNSLLQAQKYF